MKISILIPTIRLALLRESLASAQRQTHANLEILVSDDTADSSAGAFVRDVSRLDSRVRLLPPNPHKGLYENYNHLLKHVGGDAFGILDDDDRWLPDFISTLVAPLEADRDVVATFCDHWIISDGGSRLSEATERNSRLFARAGLEQGIVVDSVSRSMKGAMSVVFALFRTDRFRAEQFDHEQCAGAADLDYAIRAALKGKLYYVSERLGEYRVHQQRTTATQTGWIRRGLPGVFEKYSFSDPEPERLRVQLLRDSFRKTALDECTTDRAAWWASIRRYSALGGSLISASIGFSVLLAALPHFVGTAVRASLGGMRRRLMNLYGNRYLKLRPLVNLIEGRYRSVRRATAAIAMWPSARRRYGQQATYLMWARSISGWTTTEEALALMNVASQLPEDAVIVEVGSFLGQSAVALAGACRLRGSGRVYCVDPFDGSGDRFSEYYYAQIAAQSTKPLRERFERHVTRAGLHDWIEVNQGTAEVVGKQWTRPIDFLYLDGDQSPEGARRAFDGFLPFLKPDALIGLHNSSDRTYHEGHDGYRRLVVEVIKPPGFIVVACVGSTTFARMASTHSKAVSLRNAEELIAL